MKNDLFDLSSQVAAVIGGTGVLGGAMAQALAGAGAKVAVLGRSRERGEAAVERITKSGGTALFVPADAIDSDSLVSARDTIAKEWGPVETLINAAGGNRPEATIVPGADFCKLPVDAWRSVFDLNLVGGAFLPCQVFGETMVANQKGSIINIASLASITPMSRVVAYSAAKEAVVNLTRWLAREWATVGVRVNAVSPGFFPAEQNRALLMNPDGTYTDRGRQIIAHTPMARFGDADELAGVVVWLASPKASSFVTGQNIIVDGGFTALAI